MKKIFILTLLAVAFTASVEAQKQAPPPGGTPKDFTLPARKVSELPNGLHTTMVQYGSLPKVDIQIIVKTGNVHETADQIWLADLTGLMMKEGTSTMDFKAISKKVAAMGGELNVSAGVDNFVISGSVLSEFGPELVKVLADIVMHPAFPAEELDRLKADLKRQLAVQKSVPQAQASERFFKAIYPDHAYGRSYPTEEMLNSYTLDMVKNFYNSNFGAKRTVVYAVGKFDEAAVKAAVDGSFGPWAAGPDVNYPVATQAKTNSIAVIDRKNAPQTTVMIGLPTLTPKDKDVVALQVTNSLLGGSFGSRITSNIREDKGYTYSPFSTVQNRHGVSIWYEQADITSEHTGDALQEISKEISKLQKEAPSKEELEGIQKYMAGNFVLQNSNPGGIINQLNFLDLHGLDEKYLTERVKNIYAVTPEKVSEMTRQYFQYENMTMVLVGDKAQLEKQMKSEEMKKRMK